MQERDKEQSFTKFLCFTKFIFASVVILALSCLGIVFLWNSWTLVKEVQNKRNRVLASASVYNSGPSNSGYFLSGKVNNRRAVSSTYIHQDQFTQEQLFQALGATHPPESENKLFQALGITHRSESINKPAWEKFHEISQHALGSAEKNEDELKNSPEITPDKLEQSIVDFLMSLVTENPDPTSSSEAESRDHWELHHHLGTLAYHFYPEAALMEYVRAITIDPSRSDSWEMLNRTFQVLANKTNKKTLHNDLQDKYNTENTLKDRRKTGEKIDLNINQEQELKSAPDTASKIKVEEKYKNKFQELDERYSKAEKKLNADFAEKLAKLNQVKIPKTVNELDAEFKKKWLILLPWKNDNQSKNPGLLKNIKNDLLPPSQWPGLPRCINEVNENCLVQEGLAYYLLYLFSNKKDEEAYYLKKARTSYKQAEKNPLFASTFNLKEAFYTVHDKETVQYLSLEAKPRNQIFQEIQIQISQNTASQAQIHQLALQRPELREELDQNFEELLATNSSLAKELGALKDEVQKILRQAENFNNKFVGNIDLNEPLQKLVTAIQEAREKVTKLIPENSTLGTHISELETEVEKLQALLAASGGLINKSNELTQLNELIKKWLKGMTSNPGVKLPANLLDTITRIELLLKDLERFKPGITKETLNGIKLKVDKISAGMIHISGMAGSLNTIQPQIDKILTASKTIKTQVLDSAGNSPPVVKELLAAIKALAKETKSINDNLSGNPIIEPRRDVAKILSDIEKAVNALPGTLKEEIGPQLETINNNVATINTSVGSLETELEAQVKAKSALESLSSILTQLQGIQTKLPKKGFQDLIQKTEAVISGARTTLKNANVALKGVIATRNEIDTKVKENFFQGPQGPQGPPGGPQTPSH